MVRIALLNLLRRPVRVLLAVFGVALAGAVWLVLMALGDGYRRGLRTELDRAGVQLMVVPLGCPYDAAARVLKGRRVASGVRAMVVPGSTSVRRQAEAEGIAQVFIDAGFEWRQAGCSMCVAMNDDHLNPGDRCASSTNRNFEGRQGAGARTHLMSPAMVAAAAVTGALTDVRRLSPH